MTTPMRWPCEAIWQAVEPTLAGFSVEVLPSIDSSNSELMRRARAGHGEPILLVAEQQTAGRGRLGREWHNDPAALTFSLGMMLAPADWSGLSLAVGLCVARSLHPEIRLKWPNDLWWQGRKLAGILIETAGVAAVTARRYVVIGIGINLQTPAFAGMRTAPAGLLELLPGIDAGQVLLRVAAALVQTLQTFEQQGFAPWQVAFNASDALAGLTVTLSDGTHGLAQGVDALGALQVQTAQGLVRVTSSEISVRPEPPHAA
jgi:BirA family biotin operon repressor/biotin-[acetyl-CoA-carboxylase] ligase